MPKFEEKIEENNNEEKNKKIKSLKTYSINKKKGLGRMTTERIITNSFGIKEILNEIKEKNENEMLNKKRERDSQDNKENKEEKVEKEDEDEKTEKLKIQLKEKDDKKNK